jgi:hypothetical protein
VISIMSNFSDIGRQKNMNRGFAIQLLGGRAFILGALNVKICMPIEGINAVPEQVTLIRKQVEHLGRIVCQGIEARRFGVG